MARRMTFALLIGSALLLSGGASAEAARGGFTMAPHFSAPHFSAPRPVTAAPLRADRSIEPRRFAAHPGFDFDRPDHRFDRRFPGTQRRFANRFGAPFWGFSPDFWSDGTVAPATPEVPDYGQPTDNGSGSEDTQGSVAGSDMGSTVIRHDFPGYTVFDYCKVPPRDLNDCGPEWIVMHPSAAAPATPPAPAAGG
jgi:hypothetical protein